MPVTWSDMGQPRPENRICLRAAQNIGLPPLSTRNLTRGCGRIVGSAAARCCATASQLAHQDVVLPAALQHRPGDAVTARMNHQPLGLADHHDLEGNVDRLRGPVGNPALEPGTSRASRCCPSRIRWLPRASDPKTRPDAPLGGDEEPLGGDEPPAIEPRLNPVGRRRGALRARARGRGRSLRARAGTQPQSRGHITGRARAAATARVGARLARRAVPVGTLPRLERSRDRAGRRHVTAGARLSGFGLIHSGESGSGSSFPCRVRRPAPGRPDGRELTAVDSRFGEIRKAAARAGPAGLVGRRLELGQKCRTSAPATLSARGRRNPSRASRSRPEARLRASEPFAVRIVRHCVARGRVRERPLRQRGIRPRSGPLAGLALSPGSPIPSPPRAPVRPPGAEPASGRPGPPPPGPVPNEPDPLPLPARSPAPAPVPVPSRAEDPGRGPCARFSAPWLAGRTRTPSRARRAPHSRTVPARRNRRAIHPLRRDPPNPCPGRRACGPRAGPACRHGLPRMRSQATARPGRLPGPRPRRCRDPRLPLPAPPWPRPGDARSGSSSGMVPSQVVRLSKSGTSIGSSCSTSS